MFRWGMVYIVGSPHYWRKIQLNILSKWLMQTSAKICPKRMIYRFQLDLYLKQMFLVGMRHMTFDFVAKNGIQPGTTGTFPHFAMVKHVFLARKLCSPICLDLDVTPGGTFQ